MVRARVGQVLTGSCWTQDAQDELTEDAAEGGRAAGSGAASVPYATLYDALCSGLMHERAVLLLYDLLHECHHFHNYVLVRRYAIKSCLREGAIAYLLQFVLKRL